MTLAQYLREQLRLPGTKIACGEGGCGACTVMVSSLHPVSGKPHHVAVNSCLAPLCSMDGMAIELGCMHILTFNTHRKGGDDSRGDRLCAHTSASDTGDMWRMLRLGDAGGSNRLSRTLDLNVAFVRQALSCQCTLFSETIRILPVNRFVRRCIVEGAKRVQILHAMDGNLCRCTGYRPILTAFSSFATSGCCQGEGQSCACQKTCTTTPLDTELSITQEIIFPPELLVKVRSLAMFLAPHLRLQAKSGVPETFKQLETSSGMWFMCVNSSFPCVLPWVQPVYSRAVYCCSVPSSKCLTAERQHRGCNTMNSSPVCSCMRRLALSS